MSAAGLEARVVLSMDNKSLVGAADASVVSLDAVREAAKAAGAAGAEMGAGFDAGTVAMDGFTKSTSLAAAATMASADAKVGEIARLTQMTAANAVTSESITALAAAQSAYNTTIAEARALQAAGLITQEAYTKQVEAASAKLAISRVMADAGSVGLRQEAAAAGAIGAALRGFGQEADHAVEGAGRLESELGHLGRAFGVSREQVMLFRGAPEVFAQLLARLGPVGIAIIATAAAIGTLVAAEQLWVAKENELFDAVDANGVAVKMTGDQILGVAHQVSEAAHVTDKAATTMAASFARAGIDPKYWRELADAANRYAIATGTDVAQAAEKMASAFKDPAAALSQIEARYLALDDVQIRQIKSLAAANDKEAAGDLILKALNSTLTVTTQRTTLMGEAWEASKNAVSDWFTSTGQWIEGKMPYIEAFFIMLGRMNKAAFSNPFEKGPDLSFDAFSKLVAELKAHQKQLADGTGQVVDKVKQQAAADSAYIGQVADGLDPFVSKIATIDAQIQGVTKSLKDQNITAAVRAKGDKELKAQDWASGVKLALRELGVDTQNFAKQSADAVHSFSSEFENDFIDAITGSQNALDNFAQFFIRLLIKLAYEKYLAGFVNNLAGELVSGFGDLLGLGGGGGAGDGNPWGIYHGGDIVDGSPAQSRTVPTALLYGAPRFHTGIDSVLGRDEVPAILKKKEGVFTPRQMDNADALIAAVWSRPIVVQLPPAMAAGPGGAGGGFDVNVKVHNLDGQSSRTRATPNDSGGLDIEVLVEQLDQRMAQRVTSGRGTFQKTIQHTYGLTRNTRS